MTFELTIPDYMMEEMHIQSGIYNRTELCREMVAIFQWVLEEALAGKEIIAEDAENEVRTFVVTESIENIKRRRQKYHDGRQATTARQNA